MQTSIYYATRYALSWPPRRGAQPAVKCLATYGDITRTSHSFALNTSIMSHFPSPYNDNKALIYWLLVILQHLTVVSYILKATKMCFLVSIEVFYFLLWILYFDYQSITLHDLC